jgi:uncharacterized protein YegL
MNPIIDNFNDIDFSLNFGNFNPADVQVDETINAVFVVDVSPSIGSYVNELNHAFNDFVQTMQKSHVADQLMVSIIEFDHKVEIRSGFQPIIQVPTISFVPRGNGTALYDGTMKGLEIAIDYRQNLEMSGITAKTLVFVITDGEDNSSKIPAKEVKQEIENILSEEQNAFSFTSVLFGVGNATSFGRAQKNMGIQLLAQVGTSGAEIRKMIGFISQSIASTAGNRAVVF